MPRTLAGKKILIFKGCLLAHRELELALTARGAEVVTVTNVISAFSVLDRMSFDAAVIDKGSHNQAFELIEELRALAIPLITSDAPHALQAEPRREAAAKSVAAALEATLSSAAHDVPGQVFDHPVARFPVARGMGSMAAAGLERLN